MSKEKEYFSYNNDLSEYYEKVSLPSNGFLYGDEIPKEVELIPIKTSEEKLLLGNYSDDSTFVTKILNSCISQKFDSSDLTEPDRNYLMMRLRAISYSDSFKIQYTCSSCGSQETAEVTIDDLEVVELNSKEDAYPVVELPVSKLKLTLKPITGKDSSVLSKKLKSNREEYYIELLASRVELLTAPNGQTTQLYREIKRVISDLIGKDSSTLRDAIEESDFGIKTDIEAECSACGASNTASISIDKDFFRS